MYIYRFKDQSGDWVTLSEEKLKLLKPLHDTLFTDVEVESCKDEVIVGMEDRTCTCTDFVWRGSLRDPCIHYKAAKLFVDKTTRYNAMHELASFLRSKEKYKPKDLRNEDLCNADDEVSYFSIVQICISYGDLL